MDWWLVVLAVVGSIVVLVVNVYLLIHFQSQEDKNQAWIPKVVVVSRSNRGSPASDSPSQGVTAFFRRSCGAAIFTGTGSLGYRSQFRILHRPAAAVGRGKPFGRRAHSRCAVANYPRHRRRPGIHGHSLLHVLLRGAGS